MAATPDKNTKVQPGVTLIAGIAIQLLGVGLFSLAAGISDEMGTIMVIIMVGVLFGWLLLHASQFSHLVSDL